MTRRTTRPSATTAGVASAIAASLVPAVALACPYCAGRAGSGIGSSVVLLAFVLLPWAVAAVVIKFIRSEAPAPPLPRPDTV